MSCVRFVILDRLIAGLQRDQHYDHRGRKGKVGEGRGRVDARDVSREPQGGHADDSQLGWGGGGHPGRPHVELQHHHGRGERHGWLLLAMDVKVILTPPCTFH